MENNVTTFRDKSINSIGSSIDVLILIIENSTSDLEVLSTEQQQQELLFDKGSNSSRDDGGDSQLLTLAGLPALFDKSFIDLEVLLTTEQQTDDLSLNKSINSMSRPSTDSHSHTYSPSPIGLHVLGFMPGDNIIENLPTGSQEDIFAHNSPESNTNKSGMSKLKIKKINLRLEKKKLANSRSTKKLRPNPCQGKPCKNDY